MSQNKNTVGLVGVKSTRKDTDLKGREKIVLTLGTPEKGPGAGINQVDALLNLLEQFRGQTVKLDIRTEEKEAASGRKFPSSFIMVTKLLEENTTQKTEYVPKKDQGKTAEAKVNRINESV